MDSKKVTPGANREEESMKLEEETAGTKDKRRSEEGQMEQKDKIEKAHVIMKKS